MRKGLRELLTVFAGLGDPKLTSYLLSSFLERGRCVLFHPGRRSTDESKQSMLEDRPKSSSRTSRADFL